MMGYKYFKKLIFKIKKKNFDAFADWLRGGEIVLIILFVCLFCSLFKNKREGKKVYVMCMCVRSMKITINILRI